MLLVQWMCVLVISVKSKVTCVCCPSLSLSPSLHLLTLFLIIAFVSIQHLFSHSLLLFVSFVHLLTLYSVSIFLGPPFLLSGANLSCLFCLHFSLFHFLSLSPSLSPFLSLSLSLPPFLSFLT